MNYIKWKIEECPTDKLKMFTAAGYPPLLAAMLGVIVIAKKPRDRETPPRERI